MERDWRCVRCGKLLGRLEGDRLHIQFARGHQYVVGLPVSSVCRGCSTLNELSSLRSPSQGGVKPGIEIKN
jgi:hypothetical protein